MRIAFDANSLYNQKTGIGHYTYQLAKEVAALDRGNEIILFSKRKPFKARAEQIAMMDLEGPNIDYKFQPVHNKIFYMAWKNLRIPTTEWFAGKLDITHGTNFLPLPSNKSKKVITIHDSSFMLYPEYVAARTRMMFASQVPKVASDAHAVLTVSENARREIIELFHVPEERVHVVNCAAAESFRVLGEDKQIARDKFAQDSRYILYVGTIEPRKNIQNIVKSFNVFKKQTGDDIKLVLSGKKGWLFQDILREVERSPYKSDILFTDYVHDADMPRLYNGCELFVYPSYYEGFGIPPLEAMHCGAPVIASHAASLPEVVGEAGLLVHPDDYNDLALQIERVLSDDTLRQRMIEKGLHQANTFSWRKSAQKALGIYESLL